VTFVGSGETTLHSGLGRMIRDVKEITTTPVAVITNGSLLYLPEVREELLPADAVLPSLDAGCENVYRRINRPSPVLSFDSLVEGLAAFRAVYHGRWWVEVMLVKGMNDSEEALREIAVVLNRVRPDEVHLNVPIRPPAEPWVQPPDEEGLTRAVAMLGETARVLRPSEGQFELAVHGNVVDAVLAIITRHPMLEEELLGALEKWNPAEVGQALRELAASGRAQRIDRYGQQFWASKDACYVEQRTGTGGKVGAGPNLVAPGS
jgi:wyosine [tRNA(Phe)-imidazoG37] synthetase (radical SAM superfamily)